MTETEQGGFKYEEMLELINPSEEDSVAHKGEILLAAESVDVICVVGPLGSSKRGFTDQLREYEKKFPLPYGTELLILDYTEDNILELNTESFINILEDSVGIEESQLKPGKGLIVLTVPHSVNHL